MVRTGKGQPLVTPRLCLQMELRSLSVEMPSLGPQMQEVRGLFASTLHEGLQMAAASSTHPPMAVVGVVEAARLHPRPVSATVTATASTPGVSASKALCLLVVEAGVGGAAVGREGGSHCIRKGARGGRRDGVRGSVRGCSRRHRSERDTYCRRYGGRWEE